MKDPPELCSVGSFTIYSAALKVAKQIDKAMASGDRKDADLVITYAYDVQEIHEIANEDHLSNGEHVSVFGPVVGWHICLVAADALKGRSPVGPFSYLHVCDIVRQNDLMYLGIIDTVGLKPKLARRGAWR